MIFETITLFFFEQETITLLSFKIVHLSIISVLSLTYSVNMSHHTF
jgi:hypothetical protein